MRFDGLGLPSCVDALPMLSARLLELTRGCLAQFESNHGAGLWWVRGTFSVARVQGAQNPINNMLVSGSPVGSTMGPLFSNKDVNKFTLCCRYCSRWDRMRRWRQCRGGCSRVCNLRRCVCLAESPMHTGQCMRNCSDIVESASMLTRRKCGTQQEFALSQRATCPRGSHKRLTWKAGFRSCHFRAWSLIGHAFGP